MRWLPFGDLTRRAIEETRADFAHETRGRGMGTRVVRGLSVFTAVARIVLMGLASFDEPPFRNVGRDVRSAARRLLRAPGFTLFSIGSLALGIGATTAVYTLVYSLFLRPIEVPHLDRLVNIETAASVVHQSTPLLSFNDLQQLAANSQTCVAIEASTVFRETLSGLGTGELIEGEAVNGDYFRALGVGVEIGRPILASDASADAVPVIVLSDRTWRRQFGADPAIVGKSVTIAGTSFDVIGVAPASFRGAMYPYIMPAAVWIPLATAPLKPLGIFGLAGDLTQPSLRVRGWLAPGRTIADASAEFHLIGQRLDVIAPLAHDRAGNPTSPKPRGWSAIPSSTVFTDEVADTRGIAMASVILGLTALVLLVACTNLAGLTLARGIARRHELAVRRALGASRWRLVREQLIESAVIAGASVVPAAVLAKSAMTWLVAHMPLQVGLPLEFEPRVDLPTIAFALAGGVIALVVSGMWPALQFTRADVRATLGADTSSNAALPRWKGRGRLIAWQVVCSTCLVFLAVLAAEGVMGVRASASGLAIDRLSMAQIALPAHLKDTDNARQTMTELLRRVRLMPGVTSASLVGGLSFGSSAIGGVVTTPDKPFRADEHVGQSIALSSISAEAFDTLGMHIVQGHGFTTADSHDAPRVVVLSAFLARGLFGGVNPVGRRIRFYGGYGFSPKSVVTDADVVGVASDILLAASSKYPEAALYVPYAQADPSQNLGMMIVANSANPTASAADVRAVVKSVDPEISLVRSGPIRSAWEGVFVMLRTLGTVAAALGGLALVLAMAGLYGILSQMVLRRRREIGVRMALGADTRDVARLVIREGLRPVVSGVVVGLVFGAGVRALLYVLLHNTGRAIDPVAIVVVPLPFIAAALVAAYLPARRAAKVDPNVALRDL